MGKIKIDFDEKKLIKVVMLKGEGGKSSYDLAVENELFSGTLEEWIETFATPENYITRSEFQKVTQAQYDALKQAGQLVDNCFYLIVDDTTFADLENAVSQLQTQVETNKDDISELQTQVETNKDDISELQTTTEQQSEDLNALDNSFVDFEFTQAQNGTITLNTNVYEWISNGGNPLTTKIRAKISLYISEENYQQRYAFLPLIKFQINESPSDSSIIGYACEFYFGNNDYTLTLCQDDNSTYHTIEFNNLENNLHLYRHDIVWSGTYTSTGNHVYIAFTLYTTSDEEITKNTLYNFMTISKEIVVNGYYNDTNYGMCNLLSLYFDNYYSSQTNFEYKAKALKVDGSGTINFSIENTITDDSYLTFSDTVTTVY